MRRNMIMALITGLALNASAGGLIPKIERADFIRESVSFSKLSECRTFENKVEFYRGAFGSSYPVIIEGAGGVFVVDGRGSFGQFGTALDVVEGIQFKIEPHIGGGYLLTINSEEPQLCR